MTTRAAAKSKVKKPLETTLGKALSYSSDDPIDLSHIRKPIDTSLFGLSQVLSLFETATDEVRRYIAYECDIMYECRMCRTIYRSLANFILHKRNYCRESYKQNDHTNCRNNCQENEFFMMQEEAETCIKNIKKQNSRETSPVPPKCDSKPKPDAEVQPTETASDNLEPTDKRNLSSVVSRLLSKQESTLITEQCLAEDISDESKSSEKAEESKNNVTLQKIGDTHSGVFQTMFRNMIQEHAKMDFMRTEVMEIHDILENNEAILGSDGKIVTPQSEKSAVLKNNFMCTVCNQKFSTKKTLTYHINYKHNNTRLVYQCPECKDTFANAWGVFRHLYKVHRKSPAQVKKLRSQIHANKIRRDEQPQQRDGNNGKGTSQRLIDKLGRVDLENQQWMDDLEGDNDLQRCGGCGRKFERKAALHSHSQFCTKRIAVCNTIKENSAKKIQNEGKVEKLTRSAKTAVTTVDNGSSGSRRRKPAVAQRLCRIDYLKENQKVEENPCNSSHVNPVEVKVKLSDEKIIEDVCEVQNNERNNSNIIDICNKDDMQDNEDHVVAINTDTTKVESVTEPELQSESQHFGTADPDVELESESQNFGTASPDVELQSESQNVATTEPDAELQSESQNVGISDPDVLSVNSEPVVPVVTDAIETEAFNDEDASINNSKDFDCKHDSSSEKNSIITRSRSAILDSDDSTRKNIDSVDHDSEPSNSAINCETPTTKLTDNLTDLHDSSTKEMEQHNVDENSSDTRNNSDTENAPQKNTIQIRCTYLKKTNAENGKRKIDTSIDNSQPENSKRHKADSDSEVLNINEDINKSGVADTFSTKTKTTLELKSITYINKESQTCLSCNKGFKSYKSLMKHMALHFNWYRYQCRSCQFMSYNRSRCDHHAEKKHAIHDELTLKNSVLHIPPWKTIELSTDFKKHCRKHKINNPEDTLPELSDLNETDAAKDVNLEPPKEEETHIAHKLESSSMPDLTTPKSEPIPLKQIQDPSVRKMIMEVIFGSDISVSSQTSQEELLEIQQSSYLETDASSSKKEKQGCSRSQDFTEDSGTVLRDNSRPVRNRIAPVQKDFLYDMKQILKPKSAKEKETNASESIKEYNTVKKQKPLKVYMRKVKPKHKKPVQSMESSDENPETCKSVSDVLEINTALELTQDINMNSKDVSEIHVTGDCI